MWMELLASFITFLGPLFMRYYPFRKKLRIPVWALGLTVAVVWGGVAAGLLAFGYSEEHSSDIYRSITFVFFFTMSCFVIKDRFVRHFFVYLISYTLMAVNIGIAQFAMVRLGGGFLTMILFTLLFDLLTYPAIFYFFSRMLEPVMNMDNTKIWNIIWVPPLLSAILVAVATPGMLGAAQISYVVIRSLLGLVSVITCAILVICLGHVREQARKESALARVQEVADMKEKFLHSLSHELQLPITVVSGFAQLTGAMMGDAAIDRDAVRENMRRVDSEAGRMERLVTQLLDAAAIENGSFALMRQPMDLPSLLETAAKTYFPLIDSGQRNTIVVKAAPGLPPVYGDRERLLQVVLNLISNSVKHTEGGQITLEAELEGTMVAVAVTDNGEGIPPELMPRLFTRHSVKRTPGSSGLGMYIAEQIIHAHGGKISVESEPGRGTSVRFTIPAAKGGEQDE
ncbi:sensor histidine kinase [Eubacterium limosum]|uniref:histidine kinase n=1 Tax=Eubacterium limosum TaxID=1736 RepID=A0ABT5UIT6_EUBLI|nr:HAMP domain-containing sensor histidine kinase [Eubacterium limosum]MDE1468715.1 HAMP domain-containing sensor histidine kinase [Eubacterium limosum]